MAYKNNSNNYRRHEGKKGLHPWASRQSGRKELGVERSKMIVYLYEIATVN